MRLQAGWILLCAALAGCHSVVGGTAEPADHLGALPTSVITAPTPSSPKDKLLSAAEVAGIVGEASMTEAGRTTEPENGGSRVTPRDCAPLALPADDWLYTHYVQLNGTLLKGDGKHDVAQIVSTFNDAGAAREMVSYAVSTWQKCTEPFTISQGDDVRHVTPTPVTSDDTRASTGTQNQDNPERGCAHVLAAKGSYVVEAEVCGEDGHTARQTDEIADKILANIPE